MIVITSSLNIARTYQQKPFRSKVFLLWKVLITNKKTLLSCLLGIFLISVRWLSLIHSFFVGFLSFCFCFFNESLQLSYFAFHVHRAVVRKSLSVLGSTAFPVCLTHASSLPLLCPSPSLFRFTAFLLSKTPSVHTLMSSCSISSAETP